MLGRLYTTLQYISLPASFCFAIENVWITALMISFGTPNIVDAFIWILPNVLSILLRPYLINMVHITVHREQAEVDIISASGLAAALGCGLVGFSCLFESVLWIRIAACTIGWTLMDLGLELQLFFAQKLKDKMKSNGFQPNELTESYCESAGGILGYLASFVLCICLGGKSFKKFHLCSAYAYFGCNCLLMLYWIYLYQIQPSIYKELLSSVQQLAPSAEPAYYLPGLYELKAAPRSDQAPLALHFAVLFIVDTLLIYCTMWTIYLGEQDGMKQPAAYNYGIKIGSLVLILYEATTAAASFIPRPFITYHRFQQLLAVVGLLGLAMYWFNSLWVLVIMVVAVGIATSVYSNVVVVELRKTNMIFDTCEQLVERVQKIFILCLMPYIVMILASRDDITDCLVWMPAVIAVGLALTNYTHIKTRLMRGKGKSGGRVDKVK